MNNNFSTMKKYIQIYRTTRTIKLLCLSILTASLISCSNNAVKKIPEVSSGKLIRLENFRSKYLNPGNIDVWLPESYEAGKKNAVIYMHDGQMLFDSTTTWNKQEWHADEVITKLISEKKIKDCIVVAILVNDDYRNSEYFPVVALGRLIEPTRGSLVKTLLKDKPLSDNYLKFIVEELKPYIDSTFSTWGDPANTIIMGSGMGGIISAYAFCKYPEVFGGAGCLSTQWPVIGSGVLYNKTISDNTALAFREFLYSNLPRPAMGKIYFDYGSETTDSLNKPYQQLVDTIMKKAGYTSENWITLEFENEGHSERSLGRRLHIPLEFLLEK
jgi:predicted alpha/beta superfamily hydrolase